MIKVNTSKIIRSEPINSGSFAAVYPYRSKPDDKRYVIKENILESFEQMKKLLQEVAIGFNHDHPFIIKALGYDIKPPNIAGKDNKEKWILYIKMPRMPRDLNRRISKQGNTHFEKKKVIEWCYTLVHALEYLHKKKIAHRDLKPANILVDSNDNICLGGLELCGFLRDEDSSFFGFEQAGTRGYMAPELKDQGNKSKELFIADSWSLGITLLNICCLGDFGSLANPISEIEKIYKDDNLIYLIKKLLEIDPEKRMKISDARNFLEKHFSDDLTNIKAIIFDRLKHLYGESIFDEKIKQALSIPSMHQNFDEYIMDQEFSISSIAPQDSTLDNNKFDTIENILGSLEHMKILLQEVHDHPFIMKALRYDIKPPKDEKNNNDNEKDTLPRIPGDLNERISKQGKTHFEKKKIIEWCYTLVHALEYLHKKKIAHRDLKPANILVDSNDNLCLDGLGLCGFSRDEDSSFFGFKQDETRGYIAPELKDHENKLKQLSIANSWSLGIILLNICCLGDFGSLANPISEIEKIYKDDNLIYLIKKLLEIDPKKRIEISDALNFLEKHFSDDLNNIKAIIFNTLEYLYGESLFDETIKEAYFLYQNFKNVSDTFKFRMDQDFSIVPKDPYELKDLTIEEFTRFLAKNMKREVIKPICSVSFDFGFCDSLTDNALTYLNFTNLKWNHLEQLSLSFVGCEKITNEGVIALGSNFRGLDGLKCLSLDFSGCKQLTIKGLNRLIMTTAQSLKQKIKLTLKLTDCNELDYSRKWEDEMRRNRKEFSGELKINLYADMEFEENCITQNE